jgi:transposase
VPVRLFAGDDWAEDHHDIEVMDQAGKVLAKRRLPEGVAGMSQLHELTGRFLPEDVADAEVVIGIETDRGPWVAALVAAGYTVFPVNPLQASRYRQRHGVSGARSDGADAHMLADMVRTDSRQLRATAGDSLQAEAIKVVARTRKTLIWERTRQVQRLRHQLREYFPAALEAFADLDAPDALELLGRAPDPAKAAKLTRAQISAALKRARRRDIPGKATVILTALRSAQLGQPPAVTAAYAVTVRSLVAVITVLNQQVKTLQGQVEADLAGTRTLRSTCPSPAWDLSSAPGSSANSATTPTGTPAARPARTTPAPARSPAPPERGRSSPPGSSATTGSPTRSWPRPSTPSASRPVPAPSTTPSAPAAPSTTPPCANSPTGSSASCTDASRPAPSTTRQPPGRTRKRPLNLTSPLDT